MTTLTADKIGQRHQYLADSRPEWRQSMAAIRRQGGPWGCPSCNAPSYLSYRCSICGRDLAKSDTTSAGRDRR